MKTGLGHIGRLERHRSALNELIGAVLMYLPRLRLGRELAHQAERGEV